MPNFETELTNLLMKMFTPDELRTHAARHLGEGLHNSVPWGQSYQHVADVFVGAVIRHRCRDLWSSLRAERPQWTAQIDEVRAQAPADLQSDATGSEAQRRRRRAWSRPSLPEPFVARPRESGMLLAAMRAAHTVVGVVAPPGYGKTTLLVDVLPDVLGEPAVYGGLHNVLYYQPRRAGDLTVRHLLDDLGAPPDDVDGDEGESSAARCQAQIDVLLRLAAERRGAWVVLDDFEALLTEDGQIESVELRALLTQTALRASTRSGDPPRLRFLLGSAVRTAGSLPVVWIDLGEGMDPDGAASLLTEAGPADVLGRDDSTVIAELAQHMRRIPMGLASLARYAREAGLSYRQIARDEKIRAAAFDNSQRGLREILRLHIQSMPRDARALLRTLAVLVGPLPERVLRAAARFGEDTFAVALGALVRAGYVTRRDGQVELLGPVAEAVAEDIGEDGRLEHHAAAAAAYAVELQESRPNDWRTLDDLRPWIARIEHLIKCRRLAEATEVLGEIQAHGLTLRGYFREAAELRTRLANAIRGDDLESKRLLATNLRGSSGPYTRMGEFNRARRALERARGLCEEVGDAGELEKCWNNFGILAERQRRLREALGCYERALQIAEGIAVRDDHAIAVRLSNIAAVCVHLGHFERAQSCTDRVLRIYRGIEAWDATKHLPILATAWGTRADVHLALGEYRDAAYFGDQALAVHRAEQGHTRRQGNRLVTLGRVEMARGDNTRAVRHFQEAVSHFAAIGDKNLESAARHRLGLAHHHRGDDVLAEEAYRAGSGLNQVRSRFALHTYWGLLMLRQGREDEAFDKLQDAVEQCERLLRDAEDAIEPLYTLPLALVGLEQTGSDAWRREQVLARYADAAAHSVARGIREAALRDLGLVPIDPALSRAIRSILAAQAA